MPAAAPSIRDLPPEAMRVRPWIVWLLVSPPLVSLALNALAWLSYGIDLPYADDWRAYREGTAYSLALGDLFTPENDTLYSVGRFLDVMAMRWLAGNSVAYQFLSMLCVLGGLLWLQWKLLLRALEDPVLAAAAFGLTLFMLQPDSYWGLQNLAYHQAIPLLCLLASLHILTGQPRPAFALPGLGGLGLVSGLSYISGAFATLTLSVVVLAFAFFAPAQRRAYARSSLTLLVTGLVTTTAQIWVIVSAQQGQISAKNPWAMPDEADFWLYMAGKFGRALLLPASAPTFSFAMTMAAIALVAAIAAGLLVRLVGRRLRTVADQRFALIVLALVAVVFVYMLLVAAGRAKLRPDTVTAFLDVFAFGFLRFHFFWATLLWPWVGAAILLWLARRRAGALGAAFLLTAVLVPVAAWLGAFDHAANYKARAAYRVENEVKCFMKGLQAGGSISCPVMIGPRRDLAPIDRFARRHDASFTRYFLDLGDAGRGPRPLDEADASGDLIPAGEIVAGTIIEQVVRLDPDERRALSTDGKVCLRVLMANFGRVNVGRAKVSLRIVGRQRDVDLSFADVADNQFHRFCAPGRRIAAAGNRGVVIRIEGLEGKPGEGVTAWLSADTSRGLASVDGRATGRSLVFTIEPTAGLGFDHLSRIAACALGILALLAGFTIVRRDRRRGPAAPALF